MSDFHNNNHGRYADNSITSGSSTTAKNATSDAVDVKIDTAVQHPRGKIALEIRPIQNEPLTISEKTLQPISNPSINASVTIQESGRLGNNKFSPANSKICTHGSLVSMVSGEALLEQIDFELPGPLPLLWNRTYRSSHNNDFGLGTGWSAPYLARLLIDKTNIIYTDGEGRQIPFSRPLVGDGCRNTVEQLTLYCDNDLLPEKSELRIVSENAITWHFTGPGNTKHLSALSTTNNRCIQFHYSESGRLTEVTDSAGRRLKLEYNITNRLRTVSLLDDKGRLLGKPLVQYHYSNAGDLASVVDAAGNAQNFEYDNHVITKHTNKDGFHYYFQWDSCDIHGKCVRYWGDGNIYNRCFTYDEINKITNSTNSCGYTTVFHFNDAGLITTKIDPDGSAWEFEYDSDHRLLLERDPMGNTSQYSYNSDGMLIRFVNVLDHTTRFEYDSDACLVTVTDAMGMRWRRRYDDKSRLTSAIDPLGFTVQYQYKENHNPVAITNAMKRSLRLEWNDRCELLAKTDAAGNRQEFRYDSLGRMTEVHQRNQVNRYFFDAMGRETKIVFSNGETALLEYTPEGHLSRYTDALGHITQYCYDGAQHPIKRINPYGQVFKYGYDKERNLTAMMNENGDRYEFHYDINQRLSKEISFEGRVRHYGYNAAGHLVSHTDGANRITQFKRDALGRMIKKWSSDQDISRFEYDALGRLIRAINKEAELEYKYRDNGPLIEERQNSARIHHEYDLDNRRTATLLSKTERIDYEFNGQGLFKRISYNNTPIASVTRNVQGQEIVRTSGAVSSFFAYDSIGRIIRHRVLKHQLPVMERHYTYNLVGNLSQIDDLKSGKTIFKYDALDRLHAVEGSTPERFSYDPSSNLLDPREAFAGASVKSNRIKIFQDYRFEYDDVGNIISETKGKKRTRYVYNAQNQLVKVDKGGNISKYSYDPLGRRVKKTNKFGETTFLWDGSILLEERRNNLHIIYIHEPGNGNPLHQIRNNDAFFYHNDHLGTPQLLTDANGEIVWEARYKIYGKIFTHVCETIENNIGFQGLYLDSDTGLYCNGYRYYHPVIGRFIHQDPGGLASGTDNRGFSSNPATFLLQQELHKTQDPLLSAIGLLYNSYHYSITRPSITITPQFKLPS